MIIEALAAPGPCELIAILVVLAGIAGVIIVIVVAARSGSKAQASFPVGPGPDDRPGNFQVVGVDSQTRQDIRSEFRADSIANARVKAELEGIVVTSITRIGD